MSEPTHVQTLFEPALQAYELKTGLSLSEHPLALQLRDSHTVESITALLQDQARDFSDLRRNDRVIKNVVSILSTLSTTSALGKSTGLAFSPTKAIQAGLAILLAAANGMDTSYEALVDLLESIEHFLSRIRIYTQIPHTPAMDEIVVKIMAELLSVLAVATKELKQGRSSKMFKKLFGEKDVEVILQRLDRLTQDEARTTAAETLKILYGLIQEMNGKASVDRIREALEVLHQMASDRNKSNRDELQSKIRSWISPPDPWKNHNIARESRHSETATWFVQGETFSEWKVSGTNSLLWVHGKPGAGKSVLCSTIIEEVKTMQKLGLASLAMFYYDFREDQKKDLRGLVSSLLVQLCHQSNSYCDILFRFYLDHARGSQHPGDDELVRCLKNILEWPGQAPIFLIVDALDECPNLTLPSPREKVLILLEDLIDLRLPNLRICVTSRPEVDIKLVLDPLTFRSVSLHDERGQIEDMEKYIKSVVNMSRKMRRWKPEHKELVIEVLTKRADGMFRWVHCQLEYLSGCLPGRIQQALNELPGTLDGTYGRTLREIKDTNWEFARRLLLCVAAVSRPLRVEELADILAFDFKAGPIPKFREDWRLEDPLEAVLSTCSTLLTLVKVNDHSVFHDSEVLVIQFSHFSVKEFLTSVRFAERSDSISRHYHIAMTPAHTLIAQACLGTLLHLDEGITRDSLKGFPLVEYAAKHWFEHARLDGVSQTLDEGMKQLFDPYKVHLAVWVWIRDPVHPRFGPPATERPSRPNGNPLHYATFCGLHAVVKFLATDCSQDVHARDGYDKSTPLHLASIRGYVEDARVLIEHGADPTAQNKDGLTPLHEASKWGRVNVVLLLEHGAEVTAQDKDRSTPLHEASHWGRTAVARVLVEHGADVTAQDENGSTPLHRASGEFWGSGYSGNRPSLPGYDVDPTVQDGGRTGAHLGSVDAARFLIEHGADVTAQDKRGSSPLHLASECGYVDLARFLVMQGADATTQDKHKSTPLHRASISGKVDLVRFFVEHGADTTAKDDCGSTPLHVALGSSQGGIDLIHFLVKHGADPTARDEDGSTPLHSMLWYGTVDIAQFLVAHGADVMARDNSGSTPLHGVSSLGRTSLARFLVEHGADATAQDNDGSTPLHLVSEFSTLFLHSESEKMDLVRFLVEHEADPIARGKGGSTPLHGASESGSVDVARFLIEYGGDVMARDDLGSTPLHSPSQSGDVDMLRFLVDHGADTTAQDRKGSTPLHVVSGSPRGTIDQVRFLVEHGADMTAQDKDGSTLLHCASASPGNIAIAHLLILCGADMTAKDKDGSTPLHKALASPVAESVEVAYLLLEHGADATAQDKDGFTPLHTVSTGWGGVDIACLLVKHGADPTAQDNDGMTSLDRALAKGREDLARFFVEFSADTIALVTV